MHNYRSKLPAVALALTVFPSLAPAFGGGEPLAFGLEAERERTEFAYPGETVETRLTRGGITLFDHSTAWFMPGLHGGRLLASQPDRTFADGVDFTGYYGGVDVRSDLVSTRYLGLHGRFAYTYHSVSGTRAASGSTAETDIELSWTEAAASIGATVRASVLQVGGGGYVRVIDGQEVASGGTNHTLEFEHNERSGAYAELIYWTDPTGSVSLRLDQGARERVRVEFTRRF